MNIDLQIKSFNKIQVQTLSCQTQIPLNISQHFLKCQDFQMMSKDYLRTKSSALCKTALKECGLCPLLGYKTLFSSSYRSSLTSGNMKIFVL